jgi:hypothetical protein
MTETVLVFIDDRALSVPPGTTVLAAVARVDPSLAERIQGGSAYLTDGRGIRMDPSTPVFEGAIIRVIAPARAPRNEADAHP